MSVKKIQHQIGYAISAIHEAQIEWKNTPAHYKYLEVSQLMIQVDAMMIQLKVLEMNARDTLNTVLQREKKARRKK
jgi:hypothetical protein